MHQHGQNTEGTACVLLYHTTWMGIYGESLNDLRIHENPSLWNEIEINEG